MFKLSKLLTIERPLMKLIVTGGMGFIGTNYIKMILNGTLNGINSLVCVDSLTYAGNLKNFTKSELKDFEFVKTDINSDVALIKYFKQADAVINFAAESHVDKSIRDNTDFIKTNICGTQNLLNLAQKFNVEHFLQISTDEVYGSAKYKTFKENSALNPSSPYSASKASADLLCLSMKKTHGLNVKITRSCNNFGPYQFPEKLIPFFILRALKSHKLPIYGNGRNIREWIHVSDNCAAIHKVLMSNSKSTIFNVGSGERRSNLEIAQEILNFLGKNTSLIEYVTDRKGHDYRYALNSRKIQKYLNFRTQINFDEGLKETVDWYLLHEKKVRIE